MSDQLRQPNLPVRYVSNEAKARFLEALRENLNVTAACHQAGIRSTAGVYTQRKVDPVFAQQWQEIEEQMLDGLEELQYRSALERPEDRRWVLARLRPQKFSERRHTHITGEVTVGLLDVRSMTDAELEALIARGRAAVEPADFTVEDGDPEPGPGDDEPDDEDQGDHQEGR